MINFHFLIKFYAVSTTFLRAFNSMFPTAICLSSPITQLIFASDFSENLILSNVCFKKGILETISSLVIFDPYLFNEKESIHKNIPRLINGLVDFDRLASPIKILFIVKGDVNKRFFPNPSHHKIR